MDLQGERLLAPPGTPARSLGPDFVACGGERERIALGILGVRAVGRPELLKCAPALPLPMPSIALISLQCCDVLSKMHAALVLVNIPSS